MFQQSEFNSSGTASSCSASEAALVGGTFRRPADLALFPDMDASELCAPLAGETAAIRQISNNGFPHLTEENSFNA
jgi:hypothetical protein